MNYSRCARLSLLLVTISLSSFCQDLADFTTGKWQKISVRERGVYRINRDLFKQLGFDPATTDPRNIRIFGNGGGMLPQENAVERPAGNKEIAIHIVGESDGKFDSDDVIIFYAEGADKITFHASRKAFQREKNLYSRDNYYFITVGADAGKRVADRENIQGSFPLLTTFDDFVSHEVDTMNELESGREWYGEEFSTSTDLERTFSFSIPGIVDGSTVRIISEVMGQSYQPASFKLTFNNVSIATQPVAAIPSGTYSRKGVERRDTINVSASSVNASSGEDQQLTYEFVKASGFSQGYLDNVVINVERQLALYGSQTIFTSARSILQPASSFQIATTNKAVLVWDVTDPANVISQQYSESASSVLFSTTTDLLRNFIVFDAENLPEPKAAGGVSAANLRDAQPANLIVITHPLFKSEAERLAAHRASHSGWTTMVVTTDDVYDNFSSGRVDVTALRDFVKIMYDKNPTTVKALLLFGRGSYDYKNRLRNNTNFVPTYESRNSLSPLETYSSDDYFGFLELSEGRWSESSPIQHHTLDIGIGRIPVVNIEQAKTVVDKIISYDSQQQAHGAWRKKIVFVADDGNSDDDFNSIHQSHANELADFIEEISDGLDSRKLFMGTYPKILRPNGEVVPEMIADLDRAFESGAVIINYTGHGGEKQWADERIFTESILVDLKNDIYPFLVTATCEFGRNDNPFITSGAEMCLTLEGGGAIGLVTTARPVNAPTNFTLNMAFYQSLFEKSGGSYSHLGEVFRRTKNTSMSGVSNRNFILLGDPSMTLAIPPQEIEVTSIKTESGSDTLKALSKVIVTGVVRNGIGINTDFNGVVEATLFDKASDFVTVGRNDPAFHYNEWYNILFRGKASVEAGEFTMEFMIPKNIAYHIGEGRLSLYASSKTQPHAVGISDNFKIGGTETSVPPDTDPPHITLFVGDTTFIREGITSQDTYLVARLTDNSGINISGYSIGNSLMATLDEGTETFILNDYYVADVDNYTSGVIRFPLKNLSVGKHSITLKAWDIYNNPSFSTIEFLVGNEDELIINTFGAYPHPFSTNATLFFTHNQSGDDLEAQLFIYNSSGDLLNAETILVEQAGHTVEVLKIDNTDKKLPAGLYVARVVVRSLTNGFRKEQVAKLIILN